MQVDRSGLDPIQVALANGKLHPLRVLLRAIRSGDVSATPECMNFVERSFDNLAAQYPAEFLDFVKEMPLQVWRAPLLQSRLEWPHLMC